MLLKSVILSSFIIALSTGAFGQCKGAKKGTFISIDKIAGETVIQRNDSLQLEENKFLGIKYLEKLRWLDDCSYVVYDFKVIKTKGEINAPSGNYNVSLEKVNDSVFNQTVIIEKFNFTYKSTITKINKKTSKEFKKLLKKNDW